MNKKRFLIPVLTSVILTSCGGSSDKEVVTPGPAPDTMIPDTMTPDTMTPVVEPVPVLTLSFSPTKAFRFSWVAVPGATSYRLKEAITVASGYNPIPILATTDVTIKSFDHFVPLYGRVNAKYMLESCNAADKCTSSKEVFTSTRLTDMAESIGYFKASNTNLGDLFGNSVSLSADGNTLAVGANGEASSSQGVNKPQDDDTAFNFNVGAVYVFARNNTSAAWSQQAYLKASDSDTGDNFGFSVSLSDDGNTLAVGADFETEGEGAAYVFTRSDITWSEQVRLKASNAEAGDTFGASVSLSADGSTLAVGAVQEDSNATTIDATTIAADEDDDSAKYAGAVYVFARTSADSNSAWLQQAYLKASNSGVDDYFGGAISLSVDGNTLAVGAHGEDSNATGGKTNDSATKSGAVYVFARTGVAWSEQAYLKASNSEASDWFGKSVSISADGNTLAVGAYGEDSNAMEINGSKTDNSASASGAAYVFIRKVAVWSEQAYLKASNAEADDQFGYSVSISADGNTLAVGATGEDNNAAGINRDHTNNSETQNSGAVYTYTRSVATWSAQAYLKASNTDGGDGFGLNVVLSADGGTLAVGANAERSNAKGVNADQENDDLAAAGAVYLY